MNDHMDDDPLSYMVLFDNLEVRDADASTPFAWDVEAWVGRDVNRLYLRSEGEVTEDSDEASAELLWARPVARWWNLAAGVREDFEPGDSRTWLAMGVFGLAPYRLHLQATAYLGDPGDQPSGSRPTTISCLRTGSSCSRACNWTPMARTTKAAESVPVFQQWMSGFDFDTRCVESSLRTWESRGSTSWVKPAIWPRHPERMRTRCRRLQACESGSRLPEVTFR